MVSLHETDRRMGRPPIGDRAMTGAERVRRYRAAKHNHPPTPASASGTWAPPGHPCIVCGGPRLDGSKKWRCSKCDRQRRTDYYLSRKSVHVCSDCGSILAGPGGHSRCSSCSRIWRAGRNGRSRAAKLYLMPALRARLIFYCCRLIIDWCLQFWVPCPVCPNWFFNRELGRRYHQRQCCSAKCAAVAVVAANEPHHRRRTEASIAGRQRICQNPACARVFTAGHGHANVGKYANEGAYCSRECHYAGRRARRRQQPGPPPEGDPRHCSCGAVLPLRARICSACKEHRRLFRPCDRCGKPAPRAHGRRFCAECVASRPARLRAAGRALLELYPALRNVIDDELRGLHGEKRRKTRRVRIEALGSQALKMFPTLRTVE
jgi:hypothetical protein